MTDTFYSIIGIFYEYSWSSDLVYLIIKHDSDTSETVKLQVYDYVNNQNMYQNEISYAEFALGKIGEIRTTGGSKFYVIVTPLDVYSLNNAMSMVQHYSLAGFGTVEEFDFNLGMNSFLVNLYIIHRLQETQLEISIFLRLMLEVKSQAKFRCDHRLLRHWTDSCNYKAGYHR
jgi:hypothetical protein